MVQEIWQYISKQKKLYVLVAIAYIVGYAMTVFPTRVTQNIINALAKQQLTQHYLYQQLFILFFSTIMMYLLNYFWETRLFVNEVKYRRDLKRKLFKKLSMMRISFYDKFRSGDMMTRFTSDITYLSELLGYGAMCLLSAVGTIIIIIPQMFILNWWISLLSMIPLVILAGIVYPLGRKQDVVIDENREAVANLSNEVLEVVEGIRVTRAYANSVLGAKRFAERTSQLRHKADSIMVYQAMYGRVANVLLAFSAAIILGFGGYAMSLGQLEIGDVVALQMYSWILIEPMWMLSDFILIYKTGIVSFEKLNELLLVGDELEADGTQMLVELDKIEWKDYTFRYANSQYNGLNQLNLVLEKGQTLGIVGKTGSGKTTFIRQLLRQYPIGQGELLINGQPIQDYQRNSIERQIGYVPQEHVLFSRSVADNIKIGKADASQKELDYAVAVAAFTQDLQRMSANYNTLVGEKGVSISGGQKQRISIARAMIKAPNLLILDDSLSAVDAKTERMIIENIQLLRKDKTTMIVTHRLSAVSHADWVIVLDDGKIIEEGTPEQLLILGGWYANQYEKQQKEGGDL